MTAPTIDVETVRHLLAAVQPDLARAALRPVPTAGTDNALFRVGPDLVARLPRVPWAAAQPAREHRWLPQLAPKLPLPIPEPVVLCPPAHDYPFQWSLHRWLPGESVLQAPLANPLREARRLTVAVSLRLQKS